MNKKAILISIIAVILSFIGGFFLANSFNRKEIADLQGEVGRLKNLQKAAAEPDTESTLTPDEVREKIAQADQNPDNIEFQKNLALALYRYSTIKQDSTWLPDVVRLLNRAYDKNPKDYNLIVSIANIYFDISQFNNDVESAKKSREFYQKAIDIKSNDEEVRTDLGLTYSLAKPPENEKAVAEFKKSLEINPKNEKTLQSMAQAMIALGKTKEAEDYINKLKEVNPNNEDLTDLSSKLDESKNGLPQK